VEEITPHNTEERAMKKLREIRKTRGSEDALQYLDKLRGVPLTLGAAVHALRTGDEKTQEAFAKRLGVSVQHLSDVEKGRRRVSVERAARWRRRSGIPPRCSFGWRCRRSSTPRASSSR
jgi:DNA-binding transcriptional regulator YiaG